MPVMTSEEAKQKLFIAVMPINGNEDKLSDCPHERIEDMAAVVHVDLGDHHSALVTNEVMKQLGFTEDTLRHAAMEQSQNAHQLTIQTIEEVLGIPSFMVPQEGPHLFVASTEDTYMGAGVITYPGFMEESSKTVGGDFYLLPSSVHEVLLLQDDHTSQSANQLKDMVMTINANEVDPVDRLTDNVYHYDSNARVFETADKYEARKLHEKEFGEGKSVLKDLDARKHVADRSPRKVHRAMNKEEAL